MDPNEHAHEAGRWIITPYITKHGKRIYPKTAKYFRFWVPAAKLRK